MCFVSLWIYKIKLSFYRVVFGKKNFSPKKRIYAYIQYNAGQGTQTRRLDTGRFDFILHAPKRVLTRQHLTRIAQGMITAKCQLSKNLTIEGDWGWVWPSLLMAVHILLWYSIICSLNYRYSPFYPMSVRSNPEYKCRNLGISRVKLRDSFASGAEQVRQFHLEKRDNK